MITKVKRSNESDVLVDLVVTDKFNNKFIMTVAGNQDLYWIPKNYKQVKSFYIDENDAFLYNVFSSLFELIKKNDSDGLSYPKTLNGNKFTFISEDFHEDEAHRIEIVKEKDQFIINFIKNNNLGLYGGLRRGCVICFCNSGSRVPKVEQLFMIMFNELAYYAEEVEFDNSVNCN